MSIPTQPVPIPDRVQWALSIPLVSIFLVPRSTADRAQNLVRKTEQNRPKFRKTLVPFPYVSIPSQPVPIPDRVQWALSIPLIILFSSTPSPSDKAQNIVRTDEQKRPKLRKTLVPFAHVSIPTQPVPIPDRPKWALSIPLIIFF